MSDFLDKARVMAKDLTGKAREAVVEHSDKIDDGIDKAADFVDEKTKGKYADRISSVQTKAHEAVEKIAAEGKGPGDIDPGPGPGPAGTPPV